ncbi:MAG: hypothetical protein AAGN35_04400 [Bacteroidota bacterium]
MRYVEYIYAAAALGLLIFLALSFGELPLGPRIALMFGIAICSFMYSFRRKQRIIFERIEDEEPSSAPTAPEEHDL